MVWPKGEWMIFHKTKAESRKRLEENSNNSLEISENLEGIPLEFHHPRL